MCCRLRIYPVPVDHERVHEILVDYAGFKPTLNYPPGTYAWRRDLINGTSLLVQLLIDEALGRVLHFRLSPSITHSSDGHLRDRVNACIAFKVAMTLAEEWGSEQQGVTVEQTALIFPCKPLQGPDCRVLAHYPDQPLAFENLCLGFQMALLNGVPQLDEEDGSVPEQEYYFPDAGEEVACPMFA